MKSTKVKNLTGTALDYAVAVAEGYSPMFDTVSGEWLMSESSPYYTIKNFTPSRTPNQAYPIIVRESIETQLDEHIKGGWIALMHNSVKDEVSLVLTIGSNPMEAAMRCYVESKFGSEMDIPEELVNVS
jgi:hypothetical protein